METNTKFKLSQDQQSKKLTLEYWVKYGESNNEWLCADKIPDISLEDLKKLRDYINSVCNKNFM